MSSGAKQQTTQETEQQLGLQNQLISQTDQNSQQELGENTYNINTNLLGKAMGVPAQLLNVQEQASKSPGTGTRLGDIGLGIGSLFG